MILENIALAFTALRANKMRALLTMLGIIIGIMSIISIMTIGDAMTASVTGQLSTFGVNNITLAVQAKDIYVDEFDLVMNPNRRRWAGQTPLDSDLISDKMIADMRAFFGDDIAGVAVSHSTGSAQARDGDRYANISVMGVNADYQLANNYIMLEGRFIADSDVLMKNQSAVVSDRFVKNMFPDGVDPIGQTVKVYRASVIEIYTVIGVYYYEQMGFGGSSVPDRDISTVFFIPVSTAKQNLTQKNYNFVTVTGSDSTEIFQLTNRLRRYFDSVYAQNPNWTIAASSMESMLDTVTQMLNTLNIAIAFIAGISLLVGGIGVMNIMLVSVTERTREIGTRKAVGAKNLHIRFQFVTEAMIIAMVGGIIGVLLGLGIAAAAVSLFGAALVVSPATVIGAVIFSMSVGVFFGIYPANRAAKLDPIEALRYE